MAYLQKSFAALKGLKAFQNCLPFLGQTYFSYTDATSNQTGVACIVYLHSGMVNVIIRSVLA